MYYAHTTSLEKQEFFDNLEEIDNKLDKLINLLKNSKYTVVFTGAGISTNAGITDFRSGINTVLDTGPGLYEKQAMGLTNYKPKLDTDIINAIPTKAHMAIAKLVNEGLVNFIITLNIDGLHRKSGIPCHLIDEIHGNIFLEICNKCGQEYFRDYYVRTSHHTDNHLTGRFCDNSSCSGELMDTLVDCSEPLSFHNIDKARLECSKSDLIICFGTSFRDNPSRDIPFECKGKGGKVVNINLQKTPVNNKFEISIFGEIDDIVIKLMSKLNIQIPNWKLTHRVKFLVIPTNNNKKRLEIKTSEVDGGNETIFSKLIIFYKNSKYETNCEPYVFVDEFKENFKLEAYFNGNYNEKPIILNLNPNDINNKTFLIEFNNFTNIWDRIYSIDN